MLSWEITSQLLLLVMSSLEEMCLLTASALLSVGAAAGHGGTHHWSDCSSLGKQAEFSNIFGSTQMCVLKGAGFSGGSWLPALWICEPCKEQELHGLHSPGLTDRSWLLSAGVRGRWMFLQFLHLFACLCAPICPYRFLSKLCCINSIMLFCEASLSLGHFVQPSRSLLSTSTVCNMNLIKRNLQWFKHLPFTVPESQARTQNLTEPSTHNLM